MAAKIGEIILFTFVHRPRHNIVTNATCRSPLKGDLLSGIFHRKFISS